MLTRPDQAMEEMARELEDGTRHLADALAALQARRTPPAATAAADHATRGQSRVEHVYRGAMTALVTVDDLGEVSAKRELYRRLARTSDDLREVAERVWYSVLKER